MVKSELGLVLSRWWCVSASADVRCEKSELLVAITCHKFSNDDMQWAPTVCVIIVCSVA